MKIYVKKPFALIALLALQPLCAMNMDMSAIQEELTALVALDEDDKRFLTGAITEARYEQKFNHAGEPIGPENRGLTYLYKAMAKEKYKIISTGFKEKLEEIRKSQPHDTQTIQLLEQYLDLDYLEIALRQQAAALELIIEKREGLSKQLCIAACRNEMDTVSELISAGADVNFRERGSSFVTPLYAAIRNNNYALVKILLKAGADANGLSCSEEAPMHEAIRSKRHDILQALLEAGADIYYRRVYCTYPVALRLAAERQGPATQILLDAITTLAPHEKGLIKNWFLVNCRLRHEQRGLPKDLRLLIAHYLYQSLIRDVQDRLERAGLLYAWRVAVEADQHENRQLLERYQPKFLKPLVQKQIL